MEWNTGIFPHAIIELSTTKLTKEIIMASSFTLLAWGDYSNILGQFHFGSWVTTQEGIDTMLEMHPEAITVMDNLDGHFLWIKEGYEVELGEGHRVTN
jgi:hypothetical protein